MNWTSHERQALQTFLAERSLLHTALEVFLREQAEIWQAQCAREMATVPRHPELASDFAAKAQAYEEFWRLLEFSVQQENVLAFEKVSHGTNP